MNEEWRISTALKAADLGDIQPLVIFAAFTDGSQLRELAPLSLEIRLANFDCA